MARNVEDEGSEVDLHRDAGYEEDVTKNDSYKGVVVCSTMQTRKNSDGILIALVMMMFVRYQMQVNGPEYLPARA